MAPDERIHRAFANEQKKCRLRWELREPTGTEAKQQEKTDTLPRERPGSVSEQQNTKTPPAVEDPGESKNRTNESSGDRLGNSKNEISTLRQERSNHSARDQV
jgi:hypothetical protein